MSEKKLVTRLIIPELNGSLDGIPVVSTVTPVTPSVHVSEGELVESEGPIRSDDTNPSSDEEY